jgi:hypothetical protein
VKTLLYHTHGIGDIDFSAMRPEELPRLETMARRDELEVVPTIYLRRDRLNELTEVLECYAELSSSGLIPSIVGFAVEGPLLGPQGGIPRAGKWVPSATEWAKLARLGKKGLKYVVMAPDAMGLCDEIDDGLNFGNLVELFYDSGIRLALGHFHRDAPERSAVLTRQLIKYIHDRFVSSPYLILTDHLYNDMPRNFRHAMRSTDDQSLRKQGLAPVLVDWSQADLYDLLGPVPATLLHGAMSGQLMPCINFDGAHVDLEIVRKTVSWLGCDRLIALTDHTDLLMLAGEALTRDDKSGLLLRDDGVVAAGSSGPTLHRANMRVIGMSEQEIQTVFWDNPRKTITFTPARQTG